MRAEELTQKGAYHRLWMRVAYGRVSAGMGRRERSQVSSPLTFENSDGQAFVLEAHCLCWEAHCLTALRGCGRTTPASEVEGCWHSWPHVFANTLGCRTGRLVMSAKVRLVAAIEKMQQLLWGWSARRESWSVTACPRMICPAGQLCGVQPAWDLSHHHRRQIATTSGSRSVAVSDPKAIMCDALSYMSLCTYVQVHVPCLTYLEPDLQPGFCHDSQR